MHRSLSLGESGPPGWSGLRLRAALFLLVLVSAAFSRAQSPASSSASSSDEQPQSIADAAKAAKQNKAHAKKVLTEDDLDHKGPLPRIDMDGTDNSEEIVLSIGDYKKQHTPEETEQAIHDWYDAYDAMLATAIRDNNEIQERREATSYAGNRLCYGNPGSSVNYRKCQEQQQAEMWGRRDDGFSLRDNGMLAGRIQQEFMRVRNGICRYNLRYTWFKIRNGNGNGSF